MDDKPPAAASSEEGKKRIRLSRFDCSATRSVWPSEEEKREADSRLESMTAAFDSILQSLGEPSEGRAGLQRTPERAARALCYLTKGYEEDLEGG